MNFAELQNHGDMTERIGAAGEGERMRAERDWLQVHDCHHRWISIGGRACPYDRKDEDGDNPCANRSQVVFKCTHCGDYDYGNAGGPGHTDCVKHCGLPL